MTNVKIFKQCIAYSVEAIRHVIETFGPRDPGSEGEKKTQAYFAGELSAWSDEVRSEYFTVHPKAFMGFMIVTGFLLLTATVLYWIAPAVALPLSILAMTVAVLQFLMYRRFLDPFFSRRTSTNVLAVRRPAHETRRRIIVSGHADAAYEWRYFITGGQSLLKIVIIGAILGGVAKVAFDLRLISGGNSRRGLSGHGSRTAALLSYQAGSLGQPQS